MRWEMLAAGVLLIAMAVRDVIQQHKIVQLGGLLTELVKTLADQAMAASRAERSIDIAVLPDCDCPACAHGRERRN